MTAGPSDTQNFGTGRKIPSFYRRGDLSAIFQQDTEKLQFVVTPAKAGAQEALKRMDSCFRRNDDIRRKRLFQQTANQSLTHMEAKFKG
jgi:hypothetical protein